MMKIMKMLLKGVCIILPVIFICIYAWRNPLGFMDQEAPYYLWNKEKTNVKQDKYYKTVILGDSSANAAYIPEILSDDTINLALGGTTPVENYYILQEWLNNNNIPQVCYISFVDMHFKKEDCFWLRTMYSHRFSVKQNLEILRAAVSYHEDSIINKNYIADFISYELYLPNKYITSLLNAGFNQRYQDNIAAQKLNEIHGGRYIARGTSEYNSTNNIELDEFYVRQLFDEYYRKLIDLCMENGIQVRIVRLPLPDNKITTEKYSLEFNAYYDRLKENYQGLTVDWFPSYQRSYFADENHVNSHGALKFCKDLKKLYPNDFSGSDFSLKQVAGVNDSIINENKIDQIIQWIEGKDYTVVLNDTAKKFTSVYGEVLKENLLDLYQFNDASLNDKSSFCFISGINNRNAVFTIREAEEGYLLEMGNSQERIGDVIESDILDIVVIDNYNNNIICKKSFDYMNETYKYRE